MVDARDLASHSPVSHLIALRLVAVMLGSGAALLGAGVELDFIGRYGAAALAFSVLGFGLVLAGLVWVWRGQLFLSGGKP